MTSSTDRAGDQGDLLVADSFRVRVDHGPGTAEVRGLGRHLARFSRAAEAAWRGLEGDEPVGDESEGDEPVGDESEGDDCPPARERIDAFLAGALPTIAAYGDGFPRLELWATRDRGPELRLVLRPLPPLRAAVSLRSAGSLALPLPDRKGPNIARLSKLNRDLGAEALLLDDRGAMLEGATTALVWWCDGELHLVESQARVPSVCEALVRSIAERAEITVRPDTLTPAELAPYEVWALNALHGIRPVASIDGVALPAPDPERLVRFRGALDLTWEAMSAYRGFGVPEPLST